MIVLKKKLCHGIRVIILIPAILLLTGFYEINAQEDPPRPVVVNATAQILSFGAFYHGPAGGTVNIDPDGSRTASGDIVLLGLGYLFSAALFEVFANPGTVISILNGPDAILAGSNGGSLTLQLGSSNPASPFVTSTPYTVPTNLYIGGNLLVGNNLANPPGNYNGTFDITLVQE